MSTTPEQIETSGARAVLYRDAPGWEDARTAAFGGFACDSAAAGADLIESIAARLKQEGFDALIGPMDGDTWHSYRVVTESDGSPPFLLEPVSGPHDLEALTGAGLQPISEYVSMRAPLADAVSGTRPNIDGVTVTPWDGQNAEAFLGHLFDMSSAAFSGNRFFKPITKEQLLELYRPVIPMVDPRHVLFAHAGSSQLVGFLFGMPNKIEGDGPKSIILKTYASGMRGVGHLLADHFHRQALDLGFSHVIHALMHVDNVSSARSGMHSAEVFRRYALMGRRL